MIAIRLLVLFGSLFAAVVGPAAAASIPPGNLTANPSFESETSGWSSWQGTMSRVPVWNAPDGGYVAQVSASGSSSYTVDDWTSAVTSPTAGLIYTASARVEGVAVTDGQPVVLVVRETAQDGSEVGRASQQMTLSSSGFQPVSVNYTARDAGDRIDMYLSRPDGTIGAGDSFYADALALTSSDCAPSGLTPWSSACWHPYSSSSPFNEPVPSSPSVTSDSAAVVQSLTAGAGPGNFAAGSTTGHVPVYYTDLSAPLYTVHCAPPWGGTCAVEGVQLNIPASAQPAQDGGDRHMVVIDAQSNTEYDFWQAGSLPAGGGTLKVSWGGKTGLAGDGLGGESNAAGFGGLAGVVRASELLAGHIDHALVLAVKCDNGTYVWPAVKSDYRCADWSGPAMGARLQLNMTSAEIDALAAPAWSKTILQAFAAYGAYVEDTGSSPWGIKYESAQTYTSIGESNPWMTLATKYQWPYWPSDKDYVGHFSSDVPWSARLRVISACVAQRTC